MPTPESIEVAAQILQGGGLVGMPTETVYGIAADARNDNAVRRTFEVKGRPPDNPLIVHIARRKQLESLTREIPDAANLLADQFWPGPLTMVLPKSEEISTLVTGGRDTVAIRMPSHSVAQLILLAAGVPVSAPSANRFMALSATRADHIDPEIAVSLDIVIDGGPCSIGVESTVVDLSTTPPRILRPGSITRAQLESVIGDWEHAGSSSVRRSPGMYARHYAPKTPLVVLASVPAAAPGLVFHAPMNPNQIQMPTSPAEYATALYAALHELDLAGHDRIFAESPPSTEPWDAIWDRLRKAAEPMN